MDVPCMILLSRLSFFLLVVHVPFCNPISLPPSPINP